MISQSAHGLAAQGEFVLLQQELQADDCDVLDEDGMTPLMWACYYNQEDIVEYLISLGCNINHQATSGQTALALAASKGHFKIVQHLLSCGKCNVDLTDSDNNTALMYASAGGHTECVEELLKVGASLHLKNVEEETAFHLAVNNHRNTVVKCLEKYILDLDPLG